MYSEKWPTSVRSLKCAHAFLTIPSSKGKAWFCSPLCGPDSVMHFDWIGSDGSDSVTSEIRSEKHGGFLLALEPLLWRKADTSLCGHSSCPMERSMWWELRPPASSLWVNHLGSLRMTGSHPTAWLQPPETLSARTTQLSLFPWPKEIAKYYNYLLLF